MEEDTFNVQISRRKLNIKGSLLPNSDVSKAVVLYKPQHGKHHFGRNLVSSNGKLNSMSSERKPPIECFSVQHIKQEVPINVSSTNKESNLYSPSKAITLILLTALLLTTVIIIISPEQTRDNCENAWSGLNFKLLKTQLDSQLYGQPLAVDTIVGVLEEFQVTVEQVAVLVLLGGTGTGKTWTLQLIRNHMAGNANTVHLHLGQWSNTKELNEAFKSVDKCCKLNFLFVEDSDYAATQQIKDLKDLLLNLNRNSSCSHGKVVVVFTTNYGQKELAELLLHEREQSGSRWTISKSRVDEALAGLNSPLLKTLKLQDIPHTQVPYFPIEKTQIKQCIVHNFLSKQKSLPSSDLVEKITSHVRFFPPMTEYFAASGCKNIDSLVNLYC